MLELDQGSSTDEEAGVGESALTQPGHVIPHMDGDGVGVGDDAGTRLRLLTLNCWGLPDWITHVFRQQFKEQLPTSRSARMHRIGDRLGEWDIVTLQEMWLSHDRAIVRERAAAVGLPHQHYFKSNMLGSGLLVLSRFEIIHTDFAYYSLCGKPHRPHHGDAQSGKGIALCRIREPHSGILIDLYTTHTVAHYDDPDDYHAHRILETLEMIDFVRRTSSGALIVLTGDLNVPRSAVEYRMLIQLLGLRDSYVEANPLDRFSVTDYFDKKTLDYILIRGALGPDERAPLLPARHSFELTNVVSSTGSNKRDEDLHDGSIVLSDRVSLDGEGTPLQQRHRGSADRNSSNDSSNSSEPALQRSISTTRNVLRTGAAWHVVESFICMTHETRAEEQQTHEAWIQYCATVPDNEQDVAAACAAVLERHVGDEIFIYSDHKGISTTLEYRERPTPDVVPPADVALATITLDRTSDDAVHLRVIEDALVVALKWHKTAKRRLVLHLFRAVVALLIGLSSMFLPLGIVTLWIVPLLCFVFAAIEVLYVVGWKLSEVRKLSFGVELLRHQVALAQQQHQQQQQQQQQQQSS